MDDKDIATGMLVIMVVLLVFWGVLIYFAFWCAHHFGLIG